MFILFMFIIPVIPMVYPISEKNTNRQLILIRQIPISNQMILKAYVCMVGIKNHMQYIHCSTPLPVLLI